MRPGALGTFDSIKEQSVKKAISRWSLPAEMPLEECFKQTKAAGYDGLELAFDGEGDLDFQTTQADAEAVRRLADQNALEIAGLATGYLWTHSLTSDDPEERRQGIAAVDKMLDIAKWLGVDAVLVVPGAVHVFFLPGMTPIPYDVALDRSRSALRGLTAKAEANKVSIGLENVWNKFLLSPTEMRDFIDGFQSEYIGAYFDAGNVLPFGFPDQWIRILGPRIKRLHIKDFKNAVGTIDGFCDLLDGDVDFPAVVAALNDIHYDGWMTAEMGMSKLYPAATLHATSLAMDFILGRRSG
jgi:hexulose-6-phosphate isomerase